MQAATMTQSFLRQCLSTTNIREFPITMETSRGGPHTGKHLLRGRLLVSPAGVAELSRCVFVCVCV